MYKIDMNVYVLYIRTKDLRDNKLPVSLLLANSWLFFQKVGYSCYPLYSQMRLLTIILLVSISFSDILFSSKSIQMVFFFYTFVCYSYSQTVFTIAFFFILMYISRADKTYQYHIDWTVLYRTNIFTIGIPRSLLFSCYR